MKMGRTFQVVCLSFLALLLIVTVGTAAPSSVPVYGGILRVGLDAEPVGLDPHLTTAWSSLEVYQLIYSGLVALDEKMNIVPDIAESWTVSGDGLVYTFKLKKGVKFHNGRECVADDVKYSFDRLLDPKTAAPLRSYFEMVERVDSIDRYTAKFTLRTPYSGFLSNLAQRRPASIVPKEVVDKNGNLKNVACGTGPFMLKEYTPGVKVELVRNKDYFQKGLPYLDGITFRFIVDESSRLAAMRADEIDITSFKDPMNISLVGRNRDLSILRAPGMWRETLSLNVRSGPLANKKVRQAISCALDRQAIIDAVLMGEGDLTGIIPPGEKAWAVTADKLPFYGYDPERAKQLLKEAGYAGGLTLTAIVSPNYAPEIPSITIVQDQLKKVGISINIVQMEWGNVLAAEGSRQFQIEVHFNTHRPDPDTYVYALLHSKSSGNISGFADPQLDALLELGRTTADPVRRKQVYAEIQEFVAENAPVIYLFALRNVDVMQNRVQGYKQMPTGYRALLHETWLSK